LTEGQAISSQANVSAANVKARSAGRRQNRLHLQKALMEYLLLGRAVE
jgi:hypothetical protein